MLEAAKKKTAPPPPTEAPAAKEEACEADDAQECGEEEAAEEDAVEAWAGLGVREHATTATPLGASLVLIFDSCELQDIDWSWLISDTRASPTLRWTVGISPEPATRSFETQTSSSTLR